MGLGGNLGDPLFWFRIAARTFALYIPDLRAAPLYRSEAVSPIHQPPYLNTVLVGTARLEAVDLLAMAKALEYAAGRRRGARHAARPLDVDLLLHGDAIQSCPELRLPHPALLERRFVLQPLADLEPDLEVPTTRRTVRELLAALPPSPEAEYLGPW